jgi:hypothetical protein
MGRLNRAAESRDEKARCGSPPADEQNPDDLAGANVLFTY